MAYVVTGYWVAGYATSDSTAEVTSALQEIAPGALIELFQLELNVVQHGVAETYYFHPGTNANGYSELVWNGQAYMALPIEVEGFEYSGQGTLPRPKMRISNLMGTITALILTLPEGLEGAKFTRIRTLGRFLDAANFPARRNLFTDTNLFAWSESATSAGTQVRWRQPEAALAPDGNQTATKLSVSTDNDNQRIFISTAGVTANSPVTYSIYAKAAEYSRVSIRASAVATANAIFDLEIGEWIVNSNATSQFSVDAGNGWWRIGITYTPTTTSTVPWVQIVDNNNFITFVGDGTSGLYLWGAQLEDGPVPTEYQPIGANFTGNPAGPPDPLAEFPREVYFVDRKSAENRDVVEFELASAFDMAGVRAPKRQCITRCQWVYRSAECSYIGTNYFNASDAPVGNANQDVCGKRVDSCKARFGQNAELPHGGYVGIGSYFA
jgi:lambda family phage minor tail protein L